MLLKMLWQKKKAPVLGHEKSVNRCSPDVLMCQFVSVLPGPGVRLEGPGFQPPPHQGIDVFGAERT